MKQLLDLPAGCRYLPSQNDFHLAVVVAVVVIQLNAV